MNKMKEVAKALGYEVGGKNLILYSLPVNIQGITLLNSPKQTLWIHLVVCLLTTSVGL